MHTKSVRRLRRLAAARYLAWIAFGATGVLGATAATSATAPMAPGTAPTVVQYKTYQTSGTAGEGNSSVQFNTPTSAGDALWVAVTLSDYAGAHALSVTDTQGNVFVLLNQENDGPPGSQTVAHFYAANILGDSGTPDTVTLSTGYENYRGVLVAEIAGAAAASLVGSMANVQDGLAAGLGNVSSGSLGVAAAQTPSLLLAVSMNTSGGSSDLGGSGYGGPAAASGYTQIAQLWNWGVNLATFESAVISSPQSAVALFNAPDTDSYVTVAALFQPASAAPAPTVNLTVSPAVITAGGSATLTWSSGNAVSCTATGGWTGSETLSGSLVVTPAASALYGLGCANTNGASATASTNLTVNPAPPTATLSATPSAVAAGGSSVLTWASANATSCTASGGWSGSLAASGSLAVTPPLSTTYGLACSNAGGSSPTSSATISVTPKPPAPVPTVSLTASPASVIAGGASTLTWSSVSASACTAAGAWSGAQAPSGKLKVFPSATGTYSLSCSNSSGSSPVKSAVVTVTLPPPTVSISASATAVAAGGSTLLSWSSSNATTCAASGGWSGVQAATGSLTVTPSATSIYTLVCSNAGGSSAPKSATVAVIPPNAPALLQFQTYQVAAANGEGNSSVQFTSPTRRGDTLWIAATVSDYAGVHKISVKDSQGNTFTQLDQKNDRSPGSQSLAHFYAANIIGDASTPDTITVNWGYDNYKGVLIAEIGGTVGAPLVGHAAKIQDGLAAGANNVSSGSITVAAAQTPALLIALSMNMSGGSSDLGGSGYGGPAAAAGATPVTQCWNWGLNLATLETASLTAAGAAAAVFSAPDTDSYVTVAAIFY